MNASHSHSDFAVDYHDVADHARELDTQEESGPEESGSQSSDQDSEQDTESTNTGTSPKSSTPTLKQAYFFSKEIADKLNVTEIKETSCLQVSQNQT